MKEADIKPMPEVDAEEAGLRYCMDTVKGITRKKCGNKFMYYDPQGQVILNKTTLFRIKSLVIPPAWQKVWISPIGNGHLQATGEDKKGRKQYLYHPKWNKVRNEKKFLRMKEFGEVLPEIRKKVEADFRKKKLSKKKVLATAVTLLDETLIRVGNDEYARNNNSFGLTTLRDRHVRNLGNEVRLEFIGKKKVEREIIITDKKLARIITKCKNIPGYELFQYYDENAERQKIHSEDVNTYLKELSGMDITAKYFRTWGGSCIAIKALMEFEETDNEKDIKKNLTRAIKKVSGCLGNTPSVCKKFYIHPIILEKYSGKELIHKIKELEKGMKTYDGFSKEENIFMNILGELEKY
jgi:DNA topoisomerase-1